MGCIAGAMDQESYLDLIRERGFTDVAVVEARRLDLPADVAARLEGTGAALWSVTVTGTRPATGCCVPTCCG